MKVNKVKAGKGKLWIDSPEAVKAQLKRLSSRTFIKSHTRRQISALKKCLQLILAIDALKARYAKSINSMKGKNNERKRNNG